MVISTETKNLFIVSITRTCIIIDRTSAGQHRFGRGCTCMSIHQRVDFHHMVDLSFQNMQLKIL